MRGYEEIQVYRSAKVDTLDEIEVTSTAPHHRVEDCIVWPRTSTEEGKGEVVIDGQNVFTPPDADVRFDDQVSVRGTLYDVEGVPGDYRMGKRKKGLLVVLKALGS